MKKIFGTIILLCLICAGTSCSIAGKDIVTDQKQKLPFTDQEEEILLSLGLDLEILKAEGLDYVQRRLLDASVLALNYMEEKYHKTFTVSSATLRGILTSCDVVLLYLTSDTNQDTPIKVQISGEIKTPICSDNYLTILKQQDYQKYVQGLASSIYDNCHVYAYFGGYYSQKYSSAMTIEEIILQRELSDEDVYGDGTILVYVPNDSETQMKEKNQQFIKLLTEKHIDTGMTIYTVGTENELGQTPEDVANFSSSNSPYLNRYYIVSY